MVEPATNVEKNHHSSLCKEKADETNTSLYPKAAQFQSQFQGPSATWNGNIQGNTVYQKSKLSLSGSPTHLTMNLAGGKRKSEPLRIIDITVASHTDKDISKTLQVYTVTKTCSSAKTISKEQVGH